jgi:hypothetical protein
VARPGSAIEDAVPDDRKNKRLLVGDGFRSYVNRALFVLRCVRRELTLIVRIEAPEICSRVDSHQCSFRCVAGRWCCPNPATLTTL